MTSARLIVFPKGESFNKVKLVSFSFSKQSVLLGLSEDLGNLYQVIQVGATDKKNSWFFDNQVVSDGTIYGLLKVLKGWIFLSLYSRFSHAESVFMNVEDLLSHLYDESEEDPVLLETISTMFKANRSEIEAFLQKIMPSQDNIEGDLGFRFDVDEIVKKLHKLISGQVLMSNGDNFGDQKYFEAKWGRSDATVAIMDSLQMIIPEIIFTSLCNKFALHPAAPEDLNKRLKMSESMVLKPIKAGGSVVTPNSLAPIDDYTKIETKLKAETLKSREIKGNSKISSFFKAAK